MNILVTGGAGFIGYHTVIELAKRGDNIITIDNFNNYYDTSLKKARAKEFDKYQNITLIDCDITNIEKIEQIFENNSFDKVCHLAAQAGVRYSIENPHIYNDVNIKGTLNILEGCRNYNVKDLVFASSSSVYGANKKIPFCESDPTDNAVSLYAATKKANEVMAYTYHSLYGLNCTGLRFFTVYGPYGRPDMAIFKFTKAILENRPIDVYNNGNLKRDFTYVSDIVSGIISAIDKPHNYEIINLCKGNAIALMDFISAIENHTGKKAKLNMKPMQKGDVCETWGDNSKATRLLDYHPCIDINEGIKYFVDWYKEFYNISQ